MKIGILGTGTVGCALGTKLAHVGHEVKLGSRDANNPKAAAWAAHAPLASHGTFADAAAHGAIVINATNGLATMDALAAAGADHLAGKLLLDASNPIDFSGGDPLPVLRPGNGDSLAELIQRTYPRTNVVKALNTVNADLMVNPAAVAGDHVLFMAGDDARAKELTLGLLGELGWPADRVIDLGGVVAARGLEAYVLLWVALMRARGTSLFNVSLSGS
jgi:8-hydroxy-5-deazaflavin:NADPH oxidoreductase